MYCPVGHSALSSGSRAVLLVSVLLTLLTSPVRTWGAVACTDYAFDCRAEKVAALAIPGEVQCLVVDGSRAYVGHDRFVSIYDLTDPNRPVSIGIAQLRGVVRELAVRAGHAFVAEGAAGLEVVEVSNPRRPSVVGHVTTHDQATTILLHDHIAYVGVASGGIEMIDITSPRTPTTIGRIAPNRDVTDLKITGSTLWVSHTNGLLTLDISDPADPQPFGELGSPVPLYALEFIGELAVGAGGGGDLLVVDPSDPSQPSVVQRLRFDSPVSAVWASADELWVGEASGLVSLLEFDPSRELQIQSSRRMSGPVVGIGGHPDRVYCVARGRLITLELVEDSEHGDSIEHVLSWPVAPPPVAVAGGSSIHYIACSDGSDSGTLLAIDLRSEAEPRVVGRTDFEGEFRSLSLADGHGYVVTQRQLQVYDLGGVSPNLIAAVDLGCCAIGLEVVGHTGYLLSHRELIILDLSDPAAPREISAIDAKSFSNVVASRGHVYLAGRSQCTVFDVTDSFGPREVRTFDVEGGASNGFLTDGSYLYVVGGSWVSIFALTDPRSPSLTGRVDYDGRWAGNVIDNDYLYVARENQGVLVVDVSDRASPTALGSFANGSALHAVAVLEGSSNGIPFPGEEARVLVLDSAGLGTYRAPVCVLPEDLSTVETNWNPYDLVQIGHRLIVSHDLRGIAIYDVSEPRAPVLLSNSRNTDRRSLASFGQYLLTGSHRGFGVSEISDAGDIESIGYVRIDGGVRDIVSYRRHALVGAPRIGVVVMDLSDPTRPVAVAEVDVPGLATALAWSGGSAVVGTLNGGVHVLDVEDPRNPDLVSSFLGIDATDVVVTGTVAYILDEGGDVHVLDLSDSRAPVLRGLADLPKVSGSLGLVGTTLYVPTSRNGIHIVDVRNPLEPAVVGRTEFPSGYWIHIAPGEETVNFVGWKRFSIVRRHCDEVDVSPGDTNDDGAVDLDDLFPLAQYLGFEGQARNIGESSLDPQALPFSWAVSEATYADCDGNGMVAPEDVIALIENWTSDQPPASDRAAICSEILNVLDEVAGGPERIALSRVVESYLGGLGPFRQFRAEVARNNPARNTIGIDLMLPQSEPLVSARVYDAQGRFVGSHEWTDLPAGERRLDLDLETADLRLASGSYYFWLEAGANRAKGRFTVLR